MNKQEKVSFKLILIVGIFNIILYLIYINFQEIRKSFRTLQSTAKGTDKLVGRGGKNLKHPTL